MNWDDLRFLLAVERRGRLASAAGDLKVTKATVSRRLSALEEAVGARLVERKPGGLALTAAGRELVAAARDIESTVTAAEARVASAADSTPRGTVRVTVPQFLAEKLLIPALPELRKRHRDVDVQLIGSNEMLNLVQREADIAVRNVRPSHRSLIVRRIGAVGGCVYASERYLERRGTPTSRAEVRGHDVCAYETIVGPPGWEWLHDPDSGGRVVFRANDPGALMSAAAADLGLAALPCFLGDTQPGLCRVAALGVVRFDAFLVTHRDVRRTARVRAVSAFIVDLFARNAALIAG